MKLGFPCLPAGPFLCEPFFVLASLYLTLRWLFILFSKPFLPFGPGSRQVFNLPRLAPPPSDLFKDLFVATWIPLGNFIGEWMYLPHSAAFPSPPFFPLTLLTLAYHFSFPPFSTITMLVPSLNNSFDSPPAPSPSPEATRLFSSFFHADKKPYTVSKLVAPIPLHRSFSRSCTAVNFV